MRVKRFLLSLLMIFSCLCFVSCGKDEGDDGSVSEKQEPTIIVNYDNSSTLYVGTKLSDIDIYTVGSGTEGTVDWVNSHYELVLGKNTCSWIFTPTDAETYKSKTGSFELKALRKLTVTGVDILKSQKLYYGTLLSSVEFGDNYVAEYNGTSIAGKLEWSNPNEITKQGEHEYEWKFIPTNSDEYAEVIGTISFNADTQPVIESVSVNSGSAGLSGYVAFDEFNFSGLKLDYHLSGGAVVQETINSSNKNLCEVVAFIDKDGDEIPYSLDRNSFRQGDSGLKAKYTYSGAIYGTSSGDKTFEFDIELSSDVGYMFVDIPVYESEFAYDGNTHKLEIENTSLYTCVPVYQTNAGIYQISVKLVDFGNCRWRDASGNLINNETIEINCEILKANQTSSYAHDAIVYSGEEHQAVITINGDTAKEIYYSQTQLNKDNYLSVGLTSIKFINADSYKVYFYAEGDDNHNDLAGSFDFVIGRQTPTMELDFCYTLITGNAVVYPDDYVTLKNQKGEVIEIGNLSKTYWKVYALEEDKDNPNVKTDTLNSGAESEGAAPKNYREGGYFVLVDYMGSANYMPVKAVATLYIENDDLGLFANEGEDEFAFKENANADISTLGSNYSIVGTKQECNNYVKFEKMQVDKYGLIGISYISKFGAGDENKSGGRVVYSEGSYQLLDDDGTLIPLEIDKGSLKISLPESEFVTLGKWVIPSYVGMKFRAKTLDENDFKEGKNESCYSEITFYNDYGTIRFNAKFELKYISAGVPSGGLVTWSGLASAQLSTFENTAGNCVIVSCYNNSLTAESFNVRWPVGELESPSKITIYMTSNYEKYLLNVDFDRV